MEIINVHLLGWNDIKMVFLALPMPKKIKTVSHLARDMRYVEAANYF